MLSCKLRTFWVQQKCSACSMSVKIIDFVKKKIYFLPVFGRSYLKFNMTNLWPKFLCNALTSLNILVVFRCMS